MQSVSAPTTNQRQQPGIKTPMIVVVAIAIGAIVLSYLFGSPFAEQAAQVTAAQPAAVVDDGYMTAKTAPNDVMAILAACRQAFSELPNEPWQYIWNPNFNAAVCVYQKDGVWYPDKFAAGADFSFFVVAPLIVEYDQAGNILGPVENVVP